MSKEYLEEEVLPKLRIDCQSGVLLYDERPFQLDNGLYPFHNLEFVAQLSYGANGITYRVLHKVLGIEQLVKLYFFTDHISKEKALTESIKNSTLNLADSIARVHDLGILSEPVEVVYSIMEFVGNSMTLKDYLDNRTSFWNILSELSPGEELLQYNSIFGPLFQESINIAIYFLRGISYLIKSNIRHGDLHLDNILICNSLFSSNLLEDIEEYKSVMTSDSKSVDTEIEFIKDKLKHYNLNYLRTAINVGIVGEDSLSVKLIDLGASHVKPSTIEKTNQRDTWFIYNTISELLQPFFEAKGQMNGLMEFAFFKKVKLYGQAKKLEYHFPLEKHSPLTGGDYISHSNKTIKIQDGKCVGIDDLIFKELLENREIFKNLQVIPYPMQQENVDKDLMFSNKKCYNGQIPYQMLAAELFKVLGIVNIVYGTIFNSETPNIDGRLKQEIDNIFYFGTLEGDGGVSYDNFVISPLFDYKFHEAGNLLLRPNSRGKVWSNNLLFDYCRLFNFLINY